MAHRPQHPDPGVEQGPGPFRSHHHGLSGGLPVGLIPFGLRGSDRMWLAASRNVLMPGTGSSP